MLCVIDGLSDEKFLTLGLWGKPVIAYPVQAAINSKIFEDIIVQTNHLYVKYLINELFPEIIVLQDDYVGKEEVCIIDGRIALLTENTLQILAFEWKRGKKRINVHEGTSVIKFQSMNNRHFEKILLEMLPENEQCIVDSANNFELALVLLNKRNRSSWLRKQVLNRIVEKRKILCSTHSNNTICLLGHSQFDQWNITSLAGYNVRNCGINGITAKEYLEDIIKIGKMSFGSKVYLILLGINDVAVNNNVDEIVKQIIEIIKIVSQSDPVGKMYVLEPLNVSGRLDRDNYVVNELKEKLTNKLPETAALIKTREMNDSFGNLDYRFTTDGLHLNELGYRKFKEIIEQQMEHKSE